MRGKLVALAGVLLVVLIMPTLSHAAGAGGQQLKVFSDDGKAFFKFIDSDKNGGPSAGDLVVERAPVFDPATGERIGVTVTHVNVVKALAHGDALGLLDCTAILQGGRIMFYGSVRFSQTGQGVTFAVIGGTQSFRNAQGVVLAKDGKFKGDKGTFLTFKL